ncbi:MAG: asparagine synthetase B, partial [Bacteroidales bacterium]|nr:asparagine synthetase B [Bacteroidales bacterium]
MRKTVITFIFFILTLHSFSAYLLINMDETQKNHLKAYGIAYWILQQEVEVDWLLNYRGGSFMCKYHEPIEQECLIRGVSYQVLADVQSTSILQEIADPQLNMDVIKLHKAPKVAIYSPKNKQPWDDAVTLALTYAEIPYDVVYDEEVLDGILPLYDWLHLHHEDFTGQYGKFYGAYRGAPWYIESKRDSESLAKKLGYSKVSQEKLAVSLKIRDYVIGGGFMFAMCSATDSFDIALAASGIDICETMFDGDPSEIDYQNKIDFKKTFAFKDFKLVRNPEVYEFSSIDMTRKRREIKRTSDYFSLKEYSAKWDPIPTMLIQNHTALVKGFMGQTTSYAREQVKANVLVMGEQKTNGEARYIHGIKGKGFFTFYGGHD